MSGESWRGFLRVVAVLGAALGSAGLTASSFAVEIAEVVRVVDGDTVVLRRQNVLVVARLLGVDTPETVHPRKEVEFYGREASRFLANLLTGEQVAVVRERRRTDRYGRELVYLYRMPDGLFVNLEIVRQGYGRVLTAFPFKHQDMFLHYERQAREAQRGLWRQDSLQQKSRRSGWGAAAASPVAPVERSCVQQVLRGFAVQDQGFGFGGGPQVPQGGSEVVFAVVSVQVGEQMAQGRFEAIGQRQSFAVIQGVSVFPLSFFGPQGPAADGRRR